MVLCPAFPSQIPGLHWFETSSCLPLPHLSPPLCLGAGQPCKTCVFLSVFLHMALCGFWVLLWGFRPSDVVMLVLVLSSASSWQLSGAHIVTWGLLEAWECFQLSLEERYTLKLPAFRIEHPAYFSFWIISAGGKEIVSLKTLFPDGTIISPWNPPRLCCGVDSGNQSCPMKRAVAPVWSAATLPGYGGCPQPALVWGR